MPSIYQEAFPEPAPQPLLSTGKEINWAFTIHLFSSCQDIKLALCQMIGQSATGQGHEIYNLSEKELLYKQRISLELLEVANRISPGISRLRGVILYELQATLAAYARRKFSSGEISTEHMRNIMKEVKKYLLECIQIFSFEPPCLQEGRLATIARLDLLELETFLDSMEAKA